MRRLRRALVVAAILTILAVVIWNVATPGALFATKYASGQMQHREAYAALIGLVVLGMVALGIGFEDML